MHFIPEIFAPRHNKKENDTTFSVVAEDLFDISCII